MRRSAAVLVLALLPVLILATVLYTRVGPAESRRHLQEIATLQARRVALHDSLTAILADDPVLEFDAGDTSDVAVVLSEALVARLIRDVTARYLDRIELDLEPDIEKRKGGSFKINTPFGRMKVGDWNVDVAVHELSGVLAASTPDVKFTGTNRIHLVIPAEIREGQGRVTLHFKWDSKLAIKLVCHDFEAIQMVRGYVLPQRHVIRGDFVLSSSDRSIVADPVFPREKYAVSMTLDDSSWSQVRAALEEENRPERCGLFMSPDKVLEHLRRKGFAGIKIRLPRKLFRTIELPASITKSVQILNSPVEISVKPNQLRISPGRIWYSAEIDARRSSKPGERVPWPAGAK